MSGSRSFSALCTRHGRALRLVDERSFQRGLEQFGEGEELELFLDVVGEHYTRAQEKFFHGPILKAFMRLGYGKQDAKDMLALRFIPQEIRLLDGTIVRVPGHTSALNKKDYNAFIDDCIQLAAEQGEVVEDAEVWRAKHRSAA